MKWIKRKLRQWVNETDYAEGGKDYLVSAADSHRVNSDPILTFRIFSAQNGFILEFSNYSEKIDRRNTTAYIINEGEDIADYVRQSLPMEMLKVNQ